jgi:hypothetical protein
MEPASFFDNWDNYIKYHNALAGKIHALESPGLSSLDEAQDMINNDPLAIAMARVQYLRSPGVIPSKDDLEGIWSYYKLHYNTPLGAATHDVAMACYNKYVLGR